MAAGHPNLLFFHNALVAKVRFTPVKEDQWIGCAIIPGKIPLLEFRGPINEGCARDFLGFRG